MFAPDGKCCEVAIDHGVHNEPTFLNGVEDLCSVVNQLVVAGADALLLSMGQAHLLQGLQGRDKPSLIVRADPTSFYGSPAPALPFCNLVECAVERAVGLDAVAVVANLMWAPDQPDLHRQCVANISKLKPECERFGMPLIVEPLLWEFDKASRSYRFNPDLMRHVALVRQSVELGADVVKADPTDELSRIPPCYRDGVGKPVLLRGGSRVSEKELLIRTRALNAAWCSGGEPTAKI